jgi:hypothetical protein
MRFVIPARIHGILNPLPIRVGPRIDEHLGLNIFGH